MRRLLLVPAVLGLVGTALPAFGTVTPVSQFRRVMTFASYSPAEGEFTSSTDSFDAPGFGEWTGNAFCHVGEEGAQATSTADMVSSIDETGVSIVASTGANAEVRVPEDFAEAIGISQSTFIFEVDTTTPCHLQVDATAVENGQFTFVLRVRNGPILVIRQSEERVSIDQLVVLEPNTYEISTSSSGFGQAFGETTTIATVDYSVMFTFLSPASVSSPSSAPPGLVVHPNPFAGSTTISLQNALAAETIQVIDAAGRSVRTLLVPTGGSVQWDGRDEAGRTVNGGIYFVRGSQGPAVRVIALR